MTKNEKRGPLERKNYLKSKDREEFRREGKGSVETSPTHGPITIPTGIMDPTYTPPPQTITVDPEEQADYEEWTQWCWITAEDWQRGFEVDDLTPACQDFYQKYCVYYPDSNKPSPTPMTRFPAMCTPDRTEEEIPVETPDPIQNGVPENCECCIGFPKVHGSADLDR